MSKSKAMRPKMAARAKGAPKAAPTPAPKAYAKGGRTCMAVGGAAKVRLNQDRVGKKSFI